MVYIGTVLAFGFTTWNLEKMLNHKHHMCMVSLLIVCDFCCCNQEKMLNYELYKSVFVCFLNVELSENADPHS